VPSGFRARRALRARFTRGWGRARQRIGQPLIGVDATAAKRRGIASFSRAPTTLRVQALRPNRLLCLTPARGYGPTGATCDGSGKRPQRMFQAEVAMTIQAKQRGPVVCMQGEARRRARGWRVAACLAPVAVPFWLLACGTASQDGAGNETSTAREPSLPNTGNEPSRPNPSSAPSAGTAGGVEATPPSTSEQPAPAPMLQAPTGAGGSANGDEEPAAQQPPSAMQPPAQQPPAQQPPGGDTKLAANDVLLVGDSYFEIPNKEFNRELSRLARAEGMIGANESFRDNAISGTRLSGGFSPIPQQYTNAQAQIPARVLVVDGGGNDIIQSNCADCAGVTAAIAAAAALFQQVARDGTVEQIIYFYYPDFPNFPALRADAMDFMRPQLQSICQQSSVPCDFIDLRPLFVGHPEFTGPDNLHPSVAGSRVTAGAVFERLKASPVAQ